jgi:hypothetical protein
MLQVMGPDNTERLLLTFSSARILLNDKQRHATLNWHNTSEDVARPREFESEIATQVLKIAQALGSMGRCVAEEMSPFCLDTMYRSAIFFAYNYRKARSRDDLEGLEVL